MHHRSSFITHSYFKAGQRLWRASACFHGNTSHEITKNGKYLASLCKSCVFYFPEEPATMLLLRRAPVLTGFLEMHASGENHPCWRHMSSNHRLQWRGCVSIRAHPMSQSDACFRKGMKCLRGGEESMLIKEGGVTAILWHVSSKCSSQQHLGHLSPVTSIPFSFFKSSHLDNS